jgi:hypothetical protein
LQLPRVGEAGIIDILRISGKSSETAKPRRRSCYS